MLEHAKNLPSLGTWLRQRRNALDLTQSALAHRVGCATVTIRKLEAGAARPSRGIAKRLALCLEIPPEEHDLFLQVARGEHPGERVSLVRPAQVATRVTSVEMPIEPVPLDCVPLPAPLPAGSRMPLRRNPLFVGRDADLRQLAGALNVRGTAAIGQVEIAAATGLGGIGKTQLACEFVHRYGQFFAGGVFWLSFADPAAVPAEVAACGGSAGMNLSPEFGRLSLDEQVRRVLAVWKEPLPRLLVFDNCEDEALLAQWRPTYGGCWVLLTSRRQYWDPALGVQAVPLDVLPRAESLALLRRFRPDLASDDRDLLEIADALGDLPLALHLAGSFLAKYRHALTPGQYRARLHTPTLLDDRSLQAAGLSPTQHVQHVARTFEQSYERLDPATPIDALALTLLAHAACCAPGEPLPRWFLLRTLDLPEAERTLRAEDALTRVLDLGLLDTDAAGSLRMHRLVAIFARTVLGHDSAQAAVEATMLGVADDMITRFNRQPLMTVQPHLRFLIEAALPRADASTAALWHALGHLLWHLGTYAEAQRAHEQALAIRQRVLGAEHPDTSRSLHSLGVLFHDQGRYAEAQGYIEQALAIRQRVLGVEHPTIAQSFLNLGRVLHYQGRYAEAQGAYAQAVAIYQRVLGLDHPNTAISVGHLGWALHDQGRYAEAQGYIEQALAILQRVLGAEHQITAQSIGLLGMVLGSQGRYAEAQGYIEQALRINQGVLGAEHLFTASSLNGLGMVLGSQGRYAEAQGYLEQALRINQRVGGTQHPATAISLHSLGMVLRLQGRYAEAQGYLEQALAIQQRVLGKEHPDTARSLRTVGELLYAQGHRAQAQTYLEQVLVTFEERLGTEHPDTEQTRRLLLALDANPASAERGG